MNINLRLAMVVLAGASLAACSDYQTGPKTKLAPTSSSAADRAGALSNFAVDVLVNGAVSQVRLTGGGSFEPATASNIIPTETFAHAGGGFRCVVGVTGGPLSGCADGEGVRWDTAQLLESTQFKCTASPAEAKKTVTTSAGTAVLSADFYRAGDGTHESFTAQMFVSDHDLAPDIDGIQNVWIQGVGCGTGIVNFGHSAQQAE